MKFAFLLVVVFSAGVHASDDCEPSDPATTVHARFLERMAEFFDHPPDRVLRCPNGGLYWEAYWDVYESRSGWTKRGEAECWERRRNGGMELSGCRKSILVEHPDLPFPIRMEHEIGLDRVAEVVEFVRQSLGAESRVSLLNYMPVRDGGAWSEEEYGYRVRALENEESQHASVLQVVRDCSPTPCVWSIAVVGWATR